MNLKLLGSPCLEPDKNTPFSEFAVMLIKTTFEIEPSFALEYLGHVVTYIGSALPHQAGS